MEKCLVDGAENLAKGFAVFADAQFAQQWMP
jgi:hypothetical protein